MRILLIEKELQLLLSHRGFSASERLRTLLFYLVDKTLSDQESFLNQRQIAEDVFGRDASSFDPEKDAIVRVEINKLRKALKQYYLESGSNDPVKISIPVRTYVPRFTVKANDVETSEQGLMNLAIMPAEPYMGSSLENDLCRLLAEELTLQCAKIPNIRISRPGIGSRDVIPNTLNKKSILLFNLLYLNDGEIIVNSRLQSLATNEIIWADSAQEVFGEKTGITAIKRIAHRIASNSLDPYTGKANRKISSLAALEDNSEFHPQVAYHHYYRYLQSLCEDTYQNALNYLQQTSQRYPGNHVIECMYADLVRAGYAQGFSDSQNPIDNVFSTISRIVSDHPDCLSCRIAYCYALLQKRDLNTLHATVKTALEYPQLTPSFTAEAAMLLMITGDWDEGQSILQDQTGQLIDYPELFRYPLALNAIRKDRFDAVINILGKKPDNCSIWYWLLLIVAEANLGDKHGLEVAIEGLRYTRSNPEQAIFRTIDCYIYEKGLRNKILTSLARAGIRN